MTIFLDTSVFVAFANTRDAKHEEARDIVDGLLEGRWGRGITSDFVLDETVTVTLARTRHVETAILVGETILGTGPAGRIVDLAYVSPRTFLRTWALFRRFAARGLSFTDCTSLELMRILGIEQIASFDRDFDGVVSRRSHGGSA